MKIIIDIDKDIYNHIKNNYIPFCGKLTGETFMAKIYKSIGKGTPLPENCGKLIDSNKIEWYGCDSEKHCDEVNDNCSICKYANCERVQIERDAIIM